MIRSEKLKSDIKSIGRIHERQTDSQQRECVYYNPSIILFCKIYVNCGGFTPFANRRISAEDQFEAKRVEERKREERTHTSK